jgi:MFS superfamily sulfate permease-like transporter
MTSQSNLGKDFLASVVVFLVALPLCMGIAIACGVPPAKGILSGIIGGIIAGAIAGSPLTVSGPAAGLVVIVIDFVRDFGIEKLGAILIGAGILQAIGGLIGAGRWFRAISPAVVNGMLAGIGVLIFAGQFHVMFDDKPKSSGIENLLSIPSAIVHGLFPLDGSPHEIAAVVGLATIVCIVLWSKFRPAALHLVPAPLVGVAVGTAIAAFFNLPVNLVKLPDSLWGSIEWTQPALLLDLWKPILVFAVGGLAFIASAESLLSAVAVDRMHTGPRANFDRELLAQGVGNICCGFAGALPITGVIVRSSANVEAGAKTRLSTILHGLWMLILVVTFPHILEYIPTSALAAVLVLTGYKLVSVENAKQILRYGRLPFAIYLATLIGIVTTDLLKGVLLGIALTVIKLVYKVTQLWIRVEPNSEVPGRVDVYLEGAATFVRLPTLAHALEKIQPGAEVHLHIQRLLYIDHSCMDLIRSWEKQQESAGTRLVVEWAELNARYHAPMVLHQVE